MSKPSAADDILAGIDEALEHIEQNPLEGQPHQPPHVPLTVEQFDAAGELLYGRNWKTEMAEVMGWRDSSRVRAMVRGSRPIPKSTGFDLINQLNSRTRACLDLVEEIKAEAAKKIAAE
jgi:hypothetical protein